jgi:hypothetical protein
VTLEACTLPYVLARLVAVPQVASRFRVADLAIRYKQTAIRRPLDGNPAS